MVRMVSVELINCTVSGGRDAVGQIYFAKSIFRFFPPLNSYNSHLIKSEMDSVGSSLVLWFGRATRPSRSNRSAQQLTFLPGSHLPFHRQLLFPYFIPIAGKMCATLLELLWTCFGRIPPTGRHRRQGWINQVTVLVYSAVFGLWSSSQYSNLGV